MTVLIPKGPADRRGYRRNFAHVVAEQELRNSAAEPELANLAGDSTANTNARKKSSRTARNFGQGSDCRPLCTRNCSRVSGELSRDPLRRQLLVTSSGDDCDSYFRCHFEAPRMPRRVLYHAKQAPRPLCPKQAQQLLPYFKTARIHFGADSVSSKTTSSQNLRRAAISRYCVGEKRKRKRLGNRALQDVLMFFFVVLSTATSALAKGSASGLGSDDDLVSEMNHRQNQQNGGIFGSLWETVKRTLGEDFATTSTSSSTSSKLTSQQKMTRQQRMQQQAVAANVLRRNQLLRLSLADHYGGDVVAGKNNNALPTSESAEDLADFGRGRGKHQKCHLFQTEHGDYWWYRWCHEIDESKRKPFDVLRMTLHQVRLERTQLDGEVVITKMNSLGDAITGNHPQQLPDSSDGQVTPQHRRDLESTVVTFQEAYEEGRLRLFGVGDICMGGARRLAAVLQQENCGDPRITYMKEANPCQYYISVCYDRAQEKDAQSARIATSGEVEADRLDEQESVDYDDSVLGHQNSNESDVSDSSAEFTRSEIEQVLHMYGFSNIPSQLDRFTMLPRGFPPMPPSRRRDNAQLIKDMFQHAYDGYMYYAFPASDLRPLSCTPAAFDLVELPGMTLVDALDTLLLMKNTTEFARAVERLRSLENEDTLFAVDANVSLFETNIRVLGGLLSAHQLAVAMDAQVLNSTVFDVYVDGSVLLGTESSVCKALGEEDIVDDSGIPGQCALVSPSEGECIDVSAAAAAAAAAAAMKAKRRLERCRNTTFAQSMWKYDGFLLDLARDLGERLYPAFDTATGIPYSTVNLLTGVPFGETPIASLAGGGTLSLEMELLSRLTREPKFGRAAKLAMRALWMRGVQHAGFSPLYGKHVCTRRGEWTETLSGIGSNSDSFYEYLLKHYVVFPERAAEDAVRTPPDDLWLQTLSALGGVYNYSRAGEWYGDVDVHSASTNGRRGMVFEALAAFWPGLQTLAGQSAHAGRTLNSFCLARETVGFLPERFNYGHWRVDGQRHHLRPELLESQYYMHRNTKDLHTNGSSSWQWASDFALHALQAHTRTSCGYASVAEVSPLVGQGRVQAKLMDEMPSFFLSETLKYLYLTFVDEADDFLHNDQDRQWIFTTEAHPIHFEEPIVEKVKVEGKDSVPSRMDSLKSDVTEILRSRSNRNIMMNHRMGSAQNRWSSLESEQWTDKSSKKGFEERLNPIVAHMRNLEVVRKNNRRKSNVSHRFGSSFTRPILSPNHTLPELDAFRETNRGDNDAYLTIGAALSESHLLRRACPNFHDSRLVWVRALNGGGALDYSDVYISAAHDDDDSVSATVTASRYRLIGAVDALFLFGSGLHASELYEPTSRTEISFLTDESPGDQPVDDLESPSSGTGGAGKVLEKTRIDMGDDLGTFDVSAFPGGSGFFIQQHKSGETFVVTAVSDVSAIGTELDDPVFMVNSGVESEKEVAHDRSVIMADLKGNSYACWIELKLHDDSGHAEDSVVAAYPCAPAVFGPTRLSTLLDSGDDLIEFSEDLRIPVDGDRYGCKKVPPPQDDMAPRTIQLVHRGTCTFEDKASNVQDHADAVIVINELPDELFVMSSNGMPSTDDEDYPTTVLVTGRDGADILARIEATVHNNEDPTNSHQFLSATVYMARQHSTMEKDPDGKTTNKARIERRGDMPVWPAVRASKEALQIFSRSGWGVHAAQQTSSNHGENKVEWQLFLMQHQVGEEQKENDDEDNYDEEMV